MGEYPRKTSCYPDYEEPSNKKRWRSEMHLDEDLEYINVPIIIGAAVSAVIFLLATARTGNPEVIGSVVTLLAFSLLIWIVNRKKSTGNTAFEKHQDEAAQNIIKEREAFIKFLEREREAEDSAAFDKFMKREK